MESRWETFRVTTGHLGTDLMNGSGYGGLGLSAQHRTVVPVEKETKSGSN